MPPAAQREAPGGPIRQVRSAIAVGNGEGLVAEVFTGRKMEVRSKDGSVRFNQLWSGGDPVDMAFSSDGKLLYVADDADRLSCVELDGVLRLAGAPRRGRTAGGGRHADLRRRLGWARAGLCRGWPALCWSLDCTRHWTRMIRWGPS